MSRDAPNSSSASTLNLRTNYSGKRKQISENQESTNDSYSKMMEDDFDKKTTYATASAASTSSSNDTKIQRVPSKKSGVPTIDWILGVKDAEGNFQKLRIELCSDKLLVRLLKDLFHFWTMRESDVKTNRELAYARWGLLESHFMSEPFQKISSRLESIRQFYLAQVRKLWMWMRDRGLILKGAPTQTKDSARQLVSMRASNLKESGKDEKHIRHSIQTSEYEQSFGRIMEIIEGSYYLLKSEYQLTVFRNPNVTQRFDPRFSVCQIRLQDSSLTLTPANEALLYLYSQLHVKNYRRYRGEYVYVEEKTKNESGTHYWVEYKTIEGFVREEINRNQHFERWLNVANVKSFKNILSNLSTDISDEFPDLVVSRYHFRYEEGVFDAKECQFYFDDPVAAKVTQPVLESNIACCNKFDQPFNFAQIITYLNNAYQKDDPSTRDDAIEHEKPMHTDEPEANNGFQEKYPIQSSFANLKFGGQYETLLKYWKHIPTPMFDEILQKQGHSPEVIEVVYEQMGKMFFNVHECDFWDQMLFIKGVPGSGKSTLLNIIRKVYKKSNIGIMSPNMEEKFGLSVFEGRYFLLCPEVKRKFGLTQTDFQMCVEGEDVTLPVKFKDPKEFPWKAPLMFAGNEIMEYIEFGSNIGRRMMILEFNNRVKSVDTVLLKRIVKYEFNFLMFKWVAAYLIKCVRCGPDSIWQHVPKYFLETRKRLSGATNPMIKFLEDSDKIYLHIRPEDWKDVPSLQGATFCMREQRFRELFQKFCQDLKIEKIPAWNKDSYGDTWNEYGLRQQKLKQQGDKQKVMYFMGITEVPDLVANDFSLGHGQAKK